MISYYWGQRVSHGNLKYLFVVLTLVDEIVGVDTKTYHSNEQTLIDVRVLVDGVLFLSNVFNSQVGQVLWNRRERRVRSVRSCLAVEHR